MADDDDAGAADVHHRHNEWGKPLARRQTTGQRQTKRTCPLKIDDDDDDGGSDDDDYSDRMTGYLLLNKMQISTTMLLLLLLLFFFLAYIFV